MLAPVSPAAPTQQLQRIQLIVGESGTGTTRWVDDLAGQPVQVIAATDEARFGSDSWIQQFDQLITTTSGRHVCIDDFELLSELALQFTIDRLREQPDFYLYLICSTTEGLSPRATTLANMATARHELKRLSLRRSQVPVLAQQMIREHSANPEVKLSLDAARVLIKHDWPGNLHELEAVIKEALVASNCQDVSTQHLPRQLIERIGEPNQPLDRAEREVILAALRKFEGNKARAAKYLAISRTTLYSKIRSLRISDHAMRR